jgi:hypothetical protein
MQTQSTRECSHPTCPDTHCRRPKKQKKYYAMPKRSKKLDKQLVIYRKGRIAYLKEHPLCGAQIFPICTYEATQVHHKGGRENDLLLEQSLWLPICHGCHQFVTENSKQAIEWGLSVSRLNKAS